MHGSYFTDGAEHKTERDSGSRPLLGEGIMAAVVMEDMSTFQLKEEYKHLCTCTLYLNPCSACASNGTDDQV